MEGEILGVLIRFAKAMVSLPLPQATGVELPLFAIQICLSETGFASEPLLSPSYCLLLTLKENSNAVLI